MYSSYLIRELMREFPPLRLVMQCYQSLPKMLLNSKQCEEICNGRLGLERLRMTFM